MPLLVAELTVDTTDWTQWVPGDDYNVVSVYNKDTTSNLLFRTNSGDPTTQVTIPAGIEKQWGDYALMGQTQARFPRNVVFGYFQVVTGTGPVKIEAGR